ncbi:MAG TPA: glycerol-3-phosphate dehydrogenase/oxidase [Candidatus Limnocylindrales bacterium]|nr:glycerol-3-phosphate dehydrogenase/oxidase [Candidatus Limnocylindrales bacterium]
MTAPGPMSPSSATPLAKRSADVARLVDTTWDVLIVGGGVVGSGALLDAASRGLTAALIEQDDIAAGTSSRSSRLIHGGLRYLEQIHLPLVREALAERGRLLRNAPHLVSLDPQLFPVYGIPFLHKAFYDAGLTLYDILGARHDGGWHRRLSVDGSLEIWPSLRREGLRGGLLYHDGVEDDARFALSVLRTALASDAAPVAVTRVRATGLRADASTGPVRVVTASDLLNGGDLEIRTRSIVDATGVWAAEPGHPFASPSLRLLPSRGAHLVVPRERIPASAGLTIRVPGKVVFFIPWPDHWLIGTTDAPYEGSPEHVAASALEVDELLATVNATLDVGLTRADVVGTYAGLRPLIAPSGGSTVKASREHRVTAEPNGVVRVAGGKYTTYRVMARDVIDAALGRAAASARPSRTADLRVIGAADESAREHIAREISTIDAVVQAHPHAAARLTARHGTEAPAIAALGAETDLLRPLVPGRPFLEAEVAWAVRNELALSVDDILSRRLRLSPELGEHRGEVASRVAEIMSRELGWTPMECERERDAYLESAGREFGVPPRAWRGYAPKVGSAQTLSGA